MKWETRNDGCDVGADMERTGGEETLQDGDGELRDSQDKVLLPGDKIGPEDWETVELDVAPGADVSEVAPGVPVLKGAVVTPGVGGAWGTLPYRACVSWHRNVLVKEERNEVGASFCCPGRGGPAGEGARRDS